MSIEFKPQIPSDDRDFTSYPLSPPFGLYEELQTDSQETMRKRVAFEKMAQEILANFGSEPSKKHTKDVPFLLYEPDSVRALKTAPITLGSHLYGDLKPNARIEVIDALRPHGDGYVREVPEFSVTAQFQITGISPEDQAGLPDLLASEFMRRSFSIKGNDPQLEPPTARQLVVSHDDSHFEVPRYARKRPYRRTQTGIKFIGDTLVFDLGGHDSKPHEIVPTKLNPKNFAAKLGAYAHVMQVTAAILDRNFSPQLLRSKIHMPHFEVVSFQ